MIIRPFNLLLPFLILVSISCRSTDANETLPDHSSHEYPRLSSNEAHAINFTDSWLLIDTNELAPPEMTVTSVHLTQTIEMGKIEFQPKFEDDNRDYILLTLCSDDQSGCYTEKVFQDIFYLSRYDYRTLSIRGQKCLLTDKRTRESSECGPMSAEILYTTQSDQPKVVSEIVRDIQMIREKMFVAASDYLIDVSNFYHHYCENPDLNLQNRKICKGIFNLIQLRPARLIHLSDESVRQKIFHQWMKLAEKASDDVRNINESDENRAELEADRNELSKWVPIFIGSLGLASGIGAALYTFQKNKEISVLESKRAQILSDDILKVSGLDSHPEFIKVNQDVLDARAKRNMTSMKFKALAAGLTAASLVGAILTNLDLNLHSAVPVRHFFDLSDDYFNHFDHLQILLDDLLKQLNDELDQA